MTSQLVFLSPTFLEPVHTAHLLKTSLHGLRPRLPSSTFLASTLGFLKYALSLMHCVSPTNPTTCHVTKELKQKLQNYSLLDLSKATSE